MDGANSVGFLRGAGGPVFLECLDLSIQIPSRDYVSGTDKTDPS